LTGPAPLLRLSVGVIVERRKAVTPWIDFTWRPVGLLNGLPDATPWTELAVKGDRTAFYAGQANIDLYRSETGNYRDNLTSGRPSIWVALVEAGGNAPYRIVLATADPAEGEALTEPGVLVEAVAMPEPIRHAIAEFVAHYHVEKAFTKRKRDRADPEALARRLPANEKEDGGS
jgi:hypothetical protein